MIDATGFVAARDLGERVGVGVAKATLDQEATMRADLARYLPGGSAFQLATSPASSCCRSVSVRRASE